MSNNVSDKRIVVIGGGPGGYPAAFYAADLGMDVTLIDLEKNPGGVCLYRGCIPSKALLQSSEKYAEACHELEHHGVKVGAVELDLKAMMARKDKVVKDLTGGIAFLFKKNNVEHIKGLGTIESATQVKVTQEKSDPHTLQTRHILIATGSESAPLPGVDVDEKQIVTSTGALALTKVPKHLVVIGAGYIGLEMASVWSRLGADVTCLEFLDRITPGMDGDVAKNFQRILKKQGINFRLKTKVTGAKKTKRYVTLTVEPAAGGDVEEIKCDTVLVAIGRQPYTDGLGLDAVSVETDNRGFIRIDDEFMTSVPGIYAIGDCIPGPMLAHKAEDEGIAVAEIIAGQAGNVNYNLIPAVIYTSPEVASVGKTEEQLKEKKISYKVGKFPFLANSRAKVNNEPEGFVKILAESKTDKILGVHIIGPHCGDMIAEMVLAMEFGASAEDVARTCHAHPTHTEAIKEAALAVDKRPIHF